MQILLTGASGFIGRHLLTALLAQGHQVRCAGRHPPAMSSDPHCTFVHADFSKDSDKSVWLARLADVDVVINTVGIFRQSGQQTFKRLHTETPCALFAACADLPRPPRVLQLSALGADEQADSAYHLSKKAADDYLAQLPLRALILQPSLVYGKDGVSAAVFRKLATLPFFVRFGSAPQLVQPMHIDDLVAAIVAVLSRPDATGRIALVGPQALPFTEYVAALRAALGLGRQRVLRLPHWCARLGAALGRFIPGSLLDPEALRMLDRGNSADAGAITHLLGRPPRPVARFIDDPAAERLQAKLGWLLPMLRVALAAVWFATALVSAGLYPVEQSYELLRRTGVPPLLAPLMLYGACAVDLLMGLGTLWLKQRRLLWAAQFTLIGFYSLVIAWRLPEFLLHPYGPLTKNLPILAAIWLLYELEERK